MPRVTLHRLPLDHLMARLEAFADPPKRMREHEWTNADDERLVELRRQKLTFAEIGERMGRSFHTCAQRACRLRITRPQAQFPDWDNDQDRRLTELRRAGLSNGEIALLMKRTPHAIQMRACRLGITDGPGSNQHTRRLRKISIAA